eukprot:gene2704-2954_t
MGNSTSVGSSSPDGIRGRSYPDNKSGHSGQKSKDESEDSIAFKILQDRGSQTTKSTIGQSKKVDNWPLRITRKLVILPLLFYLAICLLFAYSETLQSVLAYMHFLRFPAGDLRDHSYVNLTNAYNIDLITQDNLLLRGYHIYPPQNSPSLPALESAERIFLYFHGSGGTRALPFRIEKTQLIASSLNAHVIAFDYRGFGDSDGWPSEAGTHLDAWAALRWVEANIPLQRTKPPIFLYGHSLGSGVATALAEDLSQQNDTRVAGLILDAPFTSLREAAMTHPAGLIFRIFPIIQDFLSKRLKFVYPSYERIGRVGIPTLLLHGDEDWKVPPYNSERLLQRAVTNSSFLETDFTAYCPYDLQRTAQSSENSASNEQNVDALLSKDGNSALDDSTLPIERFDQEYVEGSAGAGSLPIQLRIFPNVDHNHVYHAPGWVDLIRSFVSCAEKR